MLAYELLRLQKLASIDNPIPMFAEAGLPLNMTFIKKAGQCGLAVLYWSILNTC